jgi:hypothetical protein
MDLKFAEFLDDFIPHIKHRSKQEKKAALEAARAAQMKLLERKANRSKRVCLSNKNVRVRILKQKGR